MQKTVSFFSKTLFFVVLSTLVACGQAAKDNTSRREVEENARLTSIYRTLEGTYSGSIYPSKPRDLAIPVELVISVVHVSDGVDENRQIRFRPELRGFFRWKNDEFNVTRVAMLGRVYLKGSRTEALSRNDIGSVKFESINTNNGGNTGPGRQVYMNLDVTDDLLSGQYTEISNLNRTGYAEFKLEN